jgi:hypothetical protein
MTSIPIYQFCRAFDNVRWSPVYNCYVSGGYAFEKITRCNQPVPEEIRQAVINGYFALNDNYPPEKDDFALIAREIDHKYAVLAVANRQLDDGGRPTIGYKYFWLEKLSSDVDGIGTLIYWWSDQREPKFDMAQLFEESSLEIFYQQEFRKPTFQEHWLEESWKRVQELSVIPHTDVLTKHHWQGRPEYIKLHYLALGLSFRANYLNAWAWNVNKISSPESFLAIFYTTQEDIPNNIRKRQLPSLQQNNNDSNNNQITVPVQPENPTHLPAKIPNQIPPATEKQIKYCLTGLANRLSPNKTQELFGYLRDYSDADWTNCIDKNTLKNASISDIYPQLIYLIAPNDKSSQKWLLDMVKSLEIETRKASPFEDFRERLIISLLGEPENDNEPKITELQQYLLEASKKYPDVQVSKKVEDSIYSGISFLLEKLINTEQNFDKNDAKILAQKIDYFLTKSSSVWQIYFQKYAEIVAKITLYEDYEEANNYPSVITFWQPILDILSNLKNVHEQNRRSNYGNYKSLAIIFSKTQRKDLSEFLYRMSGNSGSNIPPEIRNSLDPNIRSRLFSVPNQTIYGQGASTPSIHYDAHDRGDGEAIFGFLVFIAGNIIFFTSIKIWPAYIIFSVVVYLICTIIAIALTGNPLKIRNFHIQAFWTFLYIFLTVAFLVGGVYSTIVKEPPGEDTCTTGNVNFLQDYNTYNECHIAEQLEIPDEQFETFLPSGVPTEYRNAQLSLIKQHINQIRTSDDFSTKIQQLRECQNGSPSNLRQCLNTQQQNL